MSIVNAPQHLNDVLNSRGLLGDMYEALRTMDMAGAVMSIWRVLRNTGSVPRIEKSKKNSEKSCTFRIRGNTYYLNQQYQRALGYYNKALLWAPKDSIELLRAYGNRSALLFTLEEYNASLKDIETCLKLQCTDSDLLKKLTKRKEECQKLIWNENQKKATSKNSFTEDFFKIKGKTHHQVPCLSANVDIVSEAGEMKVVALKDIAVGTVLAVETAFTTFSEQDKSHSTCHYCQKMIFNLFPCDNCCYALFCSKKCKKLCLNEYHLIECQIIDTLWVLDIGDGGGRFQLAIKTVLKLKTQCKQWSILIKESQNIGANRLKTSSLSEIYDVKNYSSILSFNDDRHFIHGPLYNSCIRHAIVIHHLQNISGFFPVERKECLKAQKCLAKLLTTLELLWPSTTEIENVAVDAGGSEILYDVPFHYGCFSFTSKLKHCCDPNVLVMGLDNQVGLVASKPIKKRSELKISFLSHWAHRKYGEQRMEKIFRNTFNICTCRICKEGWNPENASKSHFNLFQTLTYCHWAELKNNLPFPQLSETYFKETCKALTVLDKQPHTMEYCKVFSYFYVQLKVFQFVFSKNYRTTDSSDNSLE